MTAIQQYSALRLHDVGTEHRRIILSHLHSRSSFYCNSVLQATSLAWKVPTHGRVHVFEHIMPPRLGREAMSVEAVTGPIPSRLHIAYIFSSAIIGSAFPHPFPPRPPLAPPKALCKVTPKFYQDSPNVSQSRPMTSPVNGLPLLLFSIGQPPFSFGLSQWFASMKQRSHTV